MKKGMKEHQGDFKEDLTVDDILRLEGDGATTVSPSDIEKMKGKELEIWLDAMRAELASMKERDVYDEMTNAELSEKYWSKGIRTKKYQLSW